MTDVSRTTAGPSTPAVNPRRQLVIGSIGHLVEWFDWAAYSYLAVFFADAFFPKDSDSDLLPLLGAFGVFAVGFLARPFGGFVLGAFGDRHGRRAALTLTIGLMGTGSLVIALTPSYEQIGLAAPIVLVLARLMQGISTGGEWGAASAMIIESAPAGRRGLYGSSLYIASNIGKIALTLCGVALVALVGNPAMHDWGWRILFGVGALLALVGWIIRRRTVETAPRTGPRPGAFEAMRTHPRAAVQVGLFALGPAVVTYTWTAWLPAYGITQGGLPPSASLLATTGALVLFTIAQPFAAMLSDRIGRRPMLIGSAGAFVVGSVPMILAVDGSAVAQLVVMGLGLVLLSGATAIAAAVMVEQFPARLRVSGISFPYSLSVAVFGGTAPLLATAMQSAGMVWLYGVYVSLAALVSMVAAFFLRETAHAPLPDDIAGTDR